MKTAAPFTRDSRRWVPPVPAAAARPSPLGRAGPRGGCRTDRPSRWHLPRATAYDRAGCPPYPSRPAPPRWSRIWRCGAFKIGARSLGFRRGRRGHDHLVSVSMFDHRPRRCPYGHDVGPGKAKVSWTPCGCDPALEANERGRGLGHITVTCGTCWDERRVTRFYEPPHDTQHPTAH